MKKEIREIIEASADLKAVIESPEWVSGATGAYRRAMEILLSLPGVDEAVASEWLHEED